MLSWLRSDPIQEYTLKRRSGDIYLNYSSKKFSSALIHDI